MSEAAAINGLIDHFFRHQYGRTLAVLTRLFGLRNLELVEDVVQAALLQALETWKIHGIPNDPAAWMYRVARNKALDAVRHHAVADRLNPEWQSLRESESTTALDHLFLSAEVADSQLRMIFTCCHPALPEESQIALTLKTLCGFTTAEIARALLTSEDNVKKRIARARHKFVSSDIPFEVPAGEVLRDRLGPVHTVLYLLFNEGYSSSKPDELIRRDLCEESMRLCLLLLNHPISNNPETAALLSLMLLHAARFDARLDADCNILLLERQDRTVWDRELIAKGIYYLNLSAEGDRISRYHLEAAIAAEHSLAARFEETNWPAIRTHYDDLARWFPSPVHDLNRAIVIGQLEGPDAGIAAIGSIRGLETLEDYHLLHAALGELHRRAGRPDQAQASFREAMRWTTSTSERRLLERKLRECEAGISRPSGL